MNKKIGFIGLGKMATAILAGVLESKFVSATQVYAAEINNDAANAAEKKFGINICASNEELVKNADVILLCTKPFVLKDVLAEIKPFLTADKLVVSIAAGISIKTMEDIIGNVPVVRVMSNTPALVNAGMSAVAKGKFASGDDVNFVMEMFSKVGCVVEIDEKNIDAVTALSGSGPSFYYYIINQMAKAAEKLGLDYKTALTLSAQTALGAGKMILNCDDTPEALIKAVTTPGGCTEVGNNVIAQSDMQAVLENVIAKTAQKARELG